MVANNPTNSHNIKTYFNVEIDEVTPQQFSLVVYPVACR